MTKLKCKNTRKRLLIVAAVALLLLVAVSVAQPSVSVYAAASRGGDVAGAVEETWGSANEPIQRVVNNVVFPVADTIIAIVFFVKLGTAYFDYRKHGQFEFTAPCILFACLVFTLTAPLYSWKIVG